MVFWGHSVFVEKPPDIWFDLYFSPLIRVHTEDNWIFWSSAEVFWGKTVKIQRQQSSRLCLPSIYVRRIQRRGAGGVALLCGSPCLILVKNQQKSRQVELLSCPAMTSGPESRTRLQVPTQLPPQRTKKVWNQRKTMVTPAFRRQ